MNERVGSDSTEEPPVTVVIPTYNYGRYLSETIESVLSQTYKNIELIVIDDGSTDETREVVQRFLQVHYFWQPNQGTGKARNKGAAVSKGPYIIFLDGDDKLHPQYVELTIKEILKDSGVGAVYTGTEFFGNVNKIELPKKIRCRFSILGGVFGQFGASLIRRKAFEDVGGFDEALTVYEDFDFAIKLLIKKGWKLRSVDQVLHYHRVHGKNRSGDPAESKRAMQQLDQRYWFLKAYRRYTQLKLQLKSLGLSVLTAMRKLRGKHPQI